MTRMRMAALATALLPAVLGVACGDAKAPASADGATFVLNEWAITPPDAPLSAGKVRITAKNLGSEVHELVIVRADGVGSLPKKADGSVDEEAIAEADKPGEIPDVPAGKSASKTLDLKAGRYVAICNIVEGMGKGMPMGPTAGMGHVHFRLGMQTAFTVR